LPEANYIGAEDLQVRDRAEIGQRALQRQADGQSSGGDHGGK